jgi:hypothetical protein
VKPVPEAGELQSNVSLANADKCVVISLVAAADDSELVLREKRDQKRSQQAFGGVSRGCDWKLRLLVRLSDGSG